MFNIAIDGPAGAGKSTAAKLAAKKLGYIYVDTGALYRSIGLSVIRKGLDTTKRDNVIPMLSEIKVELGFENGEQHVYLNGDDVSTEIRQPLASMAASNVSVYPEVREFLTDLQRKIAAESNCLMDGRDIGTVILPNADLKIFLTATPETRAKRRFDEYQAKGITVDFNALLEEIKDRDYQDEHRETAPLKPAEDSVYLDTSNMSLEDVVNKIIELAEEKFNSER